MEIITRRLFFKLGTLQPAKALASIDDQNARIQELMQEIEALKKDAYYTQIYRQLRTTSVTLDLTPGKGGEVSTGVVLDFIFGRAILTCAHNVLDDSTKVNLSSGVSREKLLSSATNKEIKITLPNGKIVKGSPYLVQQNRKDRVVIQPELDLALVKPNIDITPFTKAAKLASKSPPGNTPIISIGNQGGGYDPNGMAFYVGEFIRTYNQSFGPTPNEIVEVTTSELTTCIRGGDSGSGAYNIETLELIGINRSTAGGDGENDAHATSTESIQKFFNLFGIKN